MIILSDFEIQTDHLISARRTGLVIINDKKERIFQIVDFAVLTAHKVKFKKNKKRDKYLDLAREQQKQLWNMKVTVMPIVTDILGTIPKGFVKGLQEVEIGGRVEIIQTTAMLRSAIILISFSLVNFEKEPVL